MPARRQRTAHKRKLDSARQRRAKQRKRDAMKTGSFDLLRCYRGIWLLDSEVAKLIARRFEEFDESVPWDAAISRLIVACVKSQIKK